MYSHLFPALAIVTSVLIISIIVYDHDQSWPSCVYCQIIVWRTSRPCRCTQRTHTLPPKNVRIRFRMSVICRVVLNFDLATPAALGWLTLKPCASQLFHPTAVLEKIRTKCISDLLDLCAKNRVNYHYIFAYVLNFFIHIPIHT